MGAWFVSNFVREEQVARAEERTLQCSPWDMLVIGGGATGVGIAVDAASRGYAVCLLEQADFGKGTSSRSTKLVHGGVRYLKQGNVALVSEALQERALLLANAPHVVRDLPFIIPCPNQWQAFFYGTGLKVYDLLAGKNNLSVSRRLSRAQVIERIPTLDARQCTAGILYYDGQFDDARLLINLAQTATGQGACLINYARVTGLIKTAARVVTGVRWTDSETGVEHESHARVVINATGPFCDDVRHMDDAGAKPMVAASQGIHLVLPKHFLPGDTAIMVPKTSDGRVVFLIPWHDRVVLGTTDTAISTVPLEPTPQPDEIEFLLSTVAEYLHTPPRRSDVLSIFTGIRPLVVANPGARTSRLPRDHTINISPHRLVTITGGKWTTYRKMAEDCVNRAAELAQLEQRTSRTRNLRIAGAPDPTVMNASVTASRQAAGDEPVILPFSVYGSHEAALKAMGETVASGNLRLDERVSVTPAQILWGVRQEMARTVEDVLARRTRALFLDARAACAIAPSVAQIMAVELEKDGQWQANQLASFLQTAQHFLP